MADKATNKDLPEGFTFEKAETKQIQFDSKAYLKSNVGKKIKLQERKKVEIIADTRHYFVGQIVEPHITMADALIKQKIAKEYVEPEPDEFDKEVDATDED